MLGSETPAPQGGSLPCAARYSEYTFPPEMSSTMAHKVVLRLAKLKSFGNVAASLSHTYRTRETPNAATELADQNTHSHSNPAEVMQALKDRLPEKRRSDAVLGLEYVVTAHQDWFKGLDKAAQDAYLMDSLEWLRKRHGSDNVVGWSIHRDEQAPIWPFTWCP